MSDSLELSLPVACGSLAGSKAAAYFELTKPRIGAMVLVATAVGFFLALPSAWDLRTAATLLITILGTGLVAGGANAINQCLEIETDRRMIRTADRPLPTGRLSLGEGALFAVAAAVAGVSLLAVLVNGLCAALAAATFLIYAFLYTPLKTRTSLCVLVGAIPGALPPVIGWAAARGSVDVGAWLLFGIIFFWQFPHVAAIAWQYREDYARAGCPLLPVIDVDGSRTRLHVVTHTVGLIAASVLPAIGGLVGPVYAISAMILGVAFLVSGMIFVTRRTTHAARAHVLASVAYLPLLLGLMMLDKSPVG